MGKVELCDLSGLVSSMSLVDLVDGDPKRRVIEWWAPIVEVVGVRGSCSACTGNESQQLNHCKSKCDAFYGLESCFDSRYRGSAIDWVYSTLDPDPDTIASSPWQNGNSSNRSWRRRCIMGWANDTCVKGHEINAGGRVGWSEICRLIQLFGERGLVAVLIGESVSVSTYFESMNVMFLQLCIAATEWPHMLGPSDNVCTGTP